MNAVERARRVTWGVVCVLVLAVYGFAARSGPLEAMGSSAAESYYNLLVRGFQSGHLSLAREAPPALARLPDPYDPAANVRLREAAEPLHDLSYYHGKLYLYFGVAPALLLFWPCAALTGHYLLQCQAAAILCAVAFLAGAALVRSVQRRYFPETPAAVLAACGLALGLATGVPILLARADVYEVAIAGGAMGIFLALAALWRALLRPETAGRWLAAASLAYGVAVASRPSLLPGAAVLLLPVFCGEGARRRHWVKNLGCAAAPLVLVGLGLLAYNDGRFGQPLEFGLRYQLAGSRQEAARPFNLRYLWFNLRVYFLEPVRWGRSFPFVRASATPPLPAGHRPPEDPFGVLTAVPLVWFALAAPLAWRRRPRGERAVLRPLAGAAACLGGSAILVLGLLDGSCSRYEVDFLPELILLAVLGILGVERALALRPRMGRALREAWSFLLALSVAFTLLAATEHHLQAQSDLGGLLLDAGRPEEAIHVLEGALRLQPDLAGARVELGDALIGRGRLGEALQQFAEGLRQDPNDFAARVNVANALAQAGRFEEAAAQYRQVLQLRPDFADADKGLGYALTQLGRGGEAIAAYAAELRIDPADADAHANLGLALAQQGLMEPAAVEFQEAVRLDPASAKFHNYLGSAWANLGRLSEAIGEYEAALRINPAEPTVRENLMAARARLPHP